MTDEEKDPRARRPPRAALGALSGLLGAFGALAVAELAASAVRPEAGPVVAVGGAAIDRAPAAVKDWAIRHFGTDDKLVLQVGILAVLAVVAVVLGALAARLGRAAAAVLVLAAFGLFGTAGALAATGRPDSTGYPDALPSALGALFGTLLLHTLLTHLRPTTTGTGPATGRRGVSGPATGPLDRPAPAAGPRGESGPVTGPRAEPSPATGPGAEPGPATGPLDRPAPAAGPRGGREPVTGPGAEPGPATGPQDQPTPAAGPRGGREPVTGPGAEPGPATGPQDQPTPVTGPQGELGLATGRQADPSSASGRQVDPSSASGRHSEATGDFDRRGFVRTAVAAAVVSASAGVVGRSLNGSSGEDAVASRRRLTLPAPGSPARPVPARAGLRVPGISPFHTPNTGFYRVDTALVVPKVDATAWRLRIHGKGVRRPVVHSFGDLLRRELIERDITLTCVSNEVGGPYVGNVRWIGVRLADLLAEAGVRPPSRGGPADQLVARSVDGMTLGTPVEDVLDGRDAMLAVGMNGEPLPFAHGFPVRMLVPGLYGYVSACKWIEDIELTTFDSYDPYWVERGWARRAPVKTQSRIDTPKPFAPPKAGPVMVAGVAWAQHRGIDKVEVRVDDGPWQEARLAAEDTRDTWRQWSFPWQAAKGPHTLTVRATDRTGRVQTERRTRTIPDGASGRHSVVVTVD
ncbi:molybdopterin-dependent oxidoreductase [Streptomyces sp. WI03-4A]|uniref:molybdopterin-dependent oxidoreductase n=1 Tax=Streptomyces sp. WI03-4A TaxID=3028706 RepID=UPI0029AD17E6|nr:molybdopterin-dependent oxidoreductase [Streptomyces sp. WI03-4A]MDX2594368.1 molybdopterin-dependent oxidoreductase [Streptomyces sp. WI03-4A]